MARVHPPAPQLSLSAFAYHRLRELICVCELRPGQCLTEREVAVRLGIGVFPARNALTRLTREGLVQRTTREGYQITPPTLKSVDDLFLTWRLVGPEIARRGVTEASEEQIPRLHRLVTEIETAADVTATPDRIGLFLENAHAMFDLLAVATANDRLVEVYRCFTGDVARIWSLVIADTTGPGLPHLDIESWRPALDQHDGDRAARLARRFIDSSHAAVMHALTY